MFVKNIDYYIKTEKYRRLAKKIDFIIRIIMLSCMFLFLIIYFLGKCGIIYAIFSKYLPDGKAFPLGTEIYFQFINVIVCGGYILLVLIFNKIFDLDIEKKHLLFTFLISIAIFIITVITY